jgi:DNA-binding transcriptional MerR regulator
VTGVTLRGLETGTQVQPYGGTVPHDIEGRRLRTGEVAERAGVNVQTLRYYERRGLIAEPRRSPGGHRTYPPDTVGLLGVIKSAQRLGFTLDEVAELLDTGRSRHPPPDLRERAVAKLAEVDRKIHDLHAIRTALSRVIEARCDSLTSCTCADCPLPFAGLAGLADGEAP